MSRRSGLALSSRQNVEPAHPGHRHVEDDHVRTPLADLSFGLLGVLRLVDVEVDDLEGRPQQHQEAGVVVDERSRRGRVPDAGAGTVSFWGTDTGARAGVLAPATTSWSRPAPLAS